jgi:hypothetical protein
MKRISLLAMLVLAFALLNAQQEIKIEDLNNHIGDSVKVCTKIFGGIYLDRSKGTPTFLNAGAAYPDAPLTLVIWGEARKKFKEAPEVFYKDKEVCINGTIVLYKGKPEIILHDEKQIGIK